MNKKFTLILIVLAIIGWFFYPGIKGKGETAEKFPSPYARSSWPTIHRDSRNSDYLPFATTDKLKLKWHALKDEYSAVLTAAVIGPEGNIYFTTGKEVEYGNLHAFNQEGNELWRSYLPDFGAFAGSPLIDQQGDLYLGDLDEFFSFHSDGTLKWKCSGIEGPFASSAFSLDGHIIGINKNGLVYVFDPQDGHPAASPLELPGQPPESAYSISLPPGLWDGMIISNDEAADEAFSGLMGYRSKITNTPAVNPANGRIYIAGTIKSLTTSNPEGRFYGIDFIPGSENNTGELRLAFQTVMGPGSGSSPAISPDGSHIYTLDGEGTLYAFNVEGEKIWTLQVNSIPASPTIGPDGTIYGLSGPGRNKLYAVKDLGNSGTILWERDFTKAFIKRLPNLVSSQVEGFTDQGVNFAIRCNSVVSVSENYLYLTLALGYEILPEEIDRPVFLPTRCFLVVLNPPTTITGRSRPIISSIVELPDTTEGIITLDKNGTVYCTHASIASSIAYFISQKAGLNLRKPTGGVTVLGPEYPQDLICSQLKWVRDVIISDLDDGVFKNKIRKRRLINKINRVLRMIDQGIYQHALDKLEGDILTRVDGCAEMDAPDENDWIITCEGQSRTYPFILDAIEELKSLI